MTKKPTAPAVKPDSLNPAEQVAAVPVDAVPVDVAATPPANPAPLSPVPPNTAPPEVAPAPTQESGRKPFEELLAGLPTWKVAALKAHTRWPAGFAVSQEQFNTALQGATGQVIR